MAYVNNLSADTLHPHKGQSGAIDTTVGPSYETLLVYRRTVEEQDYRNDWEVAPWLADGWEQVDDKTYLFRLRTGVKWHDGRDFSAADVVFTLEQILDAKNAYQVRSRLANVQSVELVAPSSVRIGLKSTSPWFLADIADKNVLMMSKASHDEGVDLTKTVVGTGPLRYKSFTTEKSVLVRNEGYWQSGRPHLSGLEIYHALDRATQNAGFFTKRFDILATAGRRQQEEIQARVPSAQTAVFFNDFGNSFIVRLDRPPYDDLRVRKAVHLAIDRQNLIKAADFGTGVINPPGMIGTKTGWAIPSDELSRMPGYRPDKTQDIAEAKRLLAEAGYPNGFKTTAMYVKERNSSPLIIEPLAGQMRAIGLDMVLDGRTSPDALKSINEGNYEMAMEFTASLDFRRQMNFLHSRSPQNKMGLRDPRLDELLDTQITVLDVEKRKAAAREMQQLLEEKMYVIPTIELAAYQMWQPWVHDYYYNLAISEKVNAFSVAHVWFDIDQMPAERR